MAVLPGGLLLGLVLSTGLAASPVVSPALAPAVFPAAAPAVFQAAAPAPNPTSHRADSLLIHGSVHGMGPGDDPMPLVGARLRLRLGGREFSTLSDAGGHYRLPAPGGSARTEPAVLTVTHLAAVETRIELILPVSGSLRLDLELESRILPLPGFRVELPRERPRTLLVPVPADAEQRVALGLLGLAGSPGMIEAGLGALLSRRPDAAEPERDRLLLTRGSTVDARAVYLDGAPLFTPFHVAGLLPAFDADLLERADLHLGGAPARFDAGLTHLLDLSTRTPRPGFRGGVGADGVTARGWVEGAGPRGGVLAAARGIHGTQSRLMDEGPFPYGYREFLVRSHLRPAAGHELRLTAYGNAEEVGLDLDLPRSLPGIALGQEAHLAPHRPRARWGNGSVSLAWNRVGPGLEWEAVGAASRYRSGVPIEATAGHLGEWEARGRSHRLRGAFELRRPAPTSQWTAGISAEDWTLDHQLLGGAGGANPPLRAARIRSTRKGGFGEWEGALAEGVWFRGGMRADGYAEIPGWVLAPRAALRLRLTHQAALEVGGGRQYQVVPSPGLELTGERPPAQEGIHWSPSLELAWAEHLVMALEQTLDPDVDVVISGFIRRYGGDVGSGFQGVRASGTDLRVGRTGESFRGWMGYALSWFWAEGNGNGSSRFQGRHLVSGGAEWEVRSGLTVGTKISYGSGLPLTALDVAVRRESDPDGEPTPVRLDPTPIRTLAGGGAPVPLDLPTHDDFLQVDLEVAWSLEPTLGGRTTQLQPYLRILNALDRRDALFHYFDGWRADGPTPVTTRPILPLVGVEWRF
ncbi:MAG: hypothetical protein EA422_07315 [Gemmatimonadales bacterium]|nr:MAG: hypothetical protein EA422_07315 [Gemmatimonadales bacterium]